MKLLCSIRRTGVFLSPWLSAAYVLRKKLLIFAGMKHIAKLLPITLAAAGLCVLGATALPLAVRGSARLCRAVGRGIKSIFIKKEK